MGAMIYCRNCGGLTLFDEPCPKCGHNNDDPDCDCERCDEDHGYDPFEDADGDFDDLDWGDEEVEF